MNLPSLHLNCILVKGCQEVDSLDFTISTKQVSKLLPKLSAFSIASCTRLSLVVKLSRWYSRKAALAKEGKIKCGKQLSDAYGST